MSPHRIAPRQRGRKRPARRWVPRMLLLGGLVLATTGCQSTAFTRLGFPPPVTKQGQVTLTLWQGGWIAAFAVGIVVWGLIVWSILFYRKRTDRVAHQVRYNLPIEILYTVIPFIMIGVFFYFTARDENFIDNLPPRPDVTVNVYGWQWSWAFQYPGYPVKTSLPRCPGTGVCEIGQMWNPQTPTRYSQLPVLEIPTHETVRFNLVSLDVIHAFWIVPFEFKRDVVPEHPNHFQVTPTSTGTFIGRCTELCGVYHSRMLFRVKIVTPAQFRTWIASQQAAQNTSGGAQ